ncbi:hypothetical protein N9B60_07005, partial [Mariniblastus sp.]|nr:hypothetical protein [Mariniblastus sp.]
AEVMAANIAPKLMYNTFLWKRKLQMQTIQVCPPTQYAKPYQYLMCLFKPHPTINHPAINRESYLNPQNVDVLRLVG